MKKILIALFNLIYPPDNEDDSPKLYELIVFYSIVFISLTILIIIKTK